MVGGANSSERNAAAVLLEEAVRAMIFTLLSPFRALGAAFRSIWAKIRGFRVLTTPEEYKERLNECDPCEFLTEERQCRICTCFVDAKAMLCAEKCPKGKWKAVWVRKSVKSG